MKIKLTFTEIKSNGKHCDITEKNIYDSDKFVLPRVGDSIYFQYSSSDEMVVTKILYEYSIFSSYSQPEKITVYLKTPQKNEDQNT